MTTTLAAFMEERAEHARKLVTLIEAKGGSLWIDGDDVITPYLHRLRLDPAAEEEICLMLGLLHAEIVTILRERGGSGVLH